MITIIAREAPLQKRALGRVCCQVQGAAQRHSGFGVATKLTEQRGTGSVEKAIAPERHRQTVDLGQRGRGAVHVAPRNRPVELTTADGIASSSASYRATI